MSAFNAQQILSAVQAAFTTASGQAPPQRVAPSKIADNCTLRVDVYSSAAGSGFEVAAVIPFSTSPPVAVKCSMQSGPDAARQQNDTLIDLLIALLYAQFQSLAVGVQAQFEPVRQAVDAALQAQNIALAKSIVSTLVITDTGLAASQAALLALFPSTS